MKQLGLSLFFLMSLKLAFSENASFDANRASQLAKKSMASFFKIQEDEVQIKGILFQDGIGMESSPAPFDYAAFYVVTEIPALVGAVASRYYPVLKLDLKKQAIILLLDKSYKLESLEPLPLYSPLNGSFVFDKEIEDPDVNMLKDIENRITRLHLADGERVKYLKSGSMFTFQLKSLTSSSRVNRMLSELERVYGTGILELSALNYIIPNSFSHTTEITDNVRNVRELRTVSRVAFGSIGSVNLKCRTLLRDTH